MYAKQCAMSQIFANGCRILVSRFPPDFAEVQVCTTGMLMILILDATITIFKTIPSDILKKIY